MIDVSLNDKDFSQIQALMFESAGMSLSSGKKALVVSRLAKRLRQLELDSYTHYVSMIKSDKQELQVAIDLISTNETYFFREVNHFRFLQDLLEQKHLLSTPFRVWSAACSYGQEAYSTAMVLADAMRYRSWEIVASDINTSVLEVARKGIYLIDEAQKIPKGYLTQYCLKGVGSQQRNFMIDRKLRDKVTFTYANLNQELPRLGEFDIIFLRNVLIYFNNETKQQVVNRLRKALKPGGYLFIGHSESLNGVSDEFEMVAPAIFRKPR